MVVGALAGSAIACVACCVYPDGLAYMADALFVGFVSLSAVECIRAGVKTFHACREERRRPRPTEAHPRRPEP